MAPALSATLAVALLAAAPQADGERVAAVFPRPVEPLAGIALEALPPPPDTVVRVTRYYGTVTVDHRKHLALRASCKSCHGPGQVTKLVYTPKVAHARCIGCHQERAKGPTACQACHVKSAPPPETQIAAVVPARAEPPPPPAPDPANLAAALAAYEAEGAAGAGRREPFHRSVELGLVAGSGSGVSVRLASHQDLVLFTQSLERLASHRAARTLGLLGAGLSRPVAPGMSVEAVALAGFDVVDRPLVALLPALGARAGFEWRAPLRYVSQLHASLTCAVDLGTRRAGGREVGGLTVYGTVATGFSLPPR